MPSSLFRRRWLVAILAGALVATGGLAYAAVPDAGGVIHACYTKSSGGLRVIDTALGQSCKANEAAIDVYSKGGADALFLDQTEANSLYLGNTEKASDSEKLDGKDSTEFLGATAAAADSMKLGGLEAETYIIGGGFHFHGTADRPDGGTESFSCCVPGDETPRITYALTCDTGGGTTLVVSSPAHFRWWWDDSYGEAVPVASGYEAALGIANGVGRHSLRAVMDNAFTTATFDLDSSIGETCRFAWTGFKGDDRIPRPG
jgi:hypothetical protein